MRYCRNTIFSIQYCSSVVSISKFNFILIFSYKNCLNQYINSASYIKRNNYYAYFTSITINSVINYTLFY